MTKEEFKRRWEKDDGGDDINMEDVADCYKQWGLGMRPKTMKMDIVLLRVLAAAGVVDPAHYPQYLLEEYDD